MADDHSDAERVRQLEERVDYLEEVLHQQIRRIYALEQRQGLVAPIRVSAPSQPPPTAPASRPTLPPPAPLPLPGRGDVPTIDWEAIVAGNWFNRIGVVAIVLAVGFFLKYAVENEWIGPLARVILGLIAGIGLLMGGEQLRDKGYRRYAHGLSGGGIAILYLSFYAAFSLYQIIGQVTAFGCMSLVTIGAVMLAARYSSLAIAILGLVGGFLTPVMLSTGVDNQTALFGYMILLDLGVLGIALFRQWRVLNYLAWGATVLLSTAWWAQWYEPSKLITTLIFLTILFLIFSFATILYNLVRHEPVRELDVVLILANGALYFRAVWSLLREDHHAWLGGFALIVAGFYGAKAWWSHRRPQPDKYLALTLAGMAVLFLTLAVPMQFNQHWVTMAWSIEGVLLTWIGIRLNRRLTRMGSLVLFLIAIAHWLGVDLGDFAWRGGDNFLPIFNKRGASIFVLISALAFSAGLYRKSSLRLCDVDDSERRYTMGGLALIAWLLLILWLSIDGRDFGDRLADSYRQLAATDESWWQRVYRIDAWKNFYLSTLWSLSGLATLAAGVRQRLATLRFVAAGLWLLTAGNISFNVIEYQSQNWYWPLINPTFGAFLVFAAALATGYREYSRSELPASRARSLCLSLANLFLLTGLSIEVDGLKIGTPGTRISFFAHQLSLSALYAAYGGTMITVGIIRANRLLRRLGLLLLGMTIVKVFFFDLASLEQIYRVLSFIVLGVTLLVVSFLYQRLRRQWKGDEEDDGEKQSDGKTTS